MYSDTLSSGERISKNPLGCSYTHVLGSTDLARDMEEDFCVTVYKKQVHVRQAVRCNSVRSAAMYGHSDKHATHSLDHLTSTNRAKIINSLSLTASISQHHTAPLHTAALNGKDSL